MRSQALMLLCVAPLAHANDFPTRARVEFVLGCMRDSKASPQESMYKCSCAIDVIADKVKYSEWVDLLDDLQRHHDRRRARRRHARHEGRPQADHFRTRTAGERQEAVLPHRVSAGGPSGIRAIARIRPVAAGGAVDFDGRGLRGVSRAAGQLSEEVRKLWIEKFGIRVLEGYGVTECAPVIAVNVPMACRIGSVGQLAPGMQYELEPVAGIENAGVLHVAGPNVMKGYLLFDEPGVIQPPKSIHDGWYSTGDIVHVDEDEFVHIRGRVKRFAKIAGEMIGQVVERIIGCGSDVRPCGRYAHRCWKARHWCCYAPIERNVGTRAAGAVAKSSRRA